MDTTTGLSRRQDPNLAQHLEKDAVPHSILTADDYYTPEEALEVAILLLQRLCREIHSPDSLSLVFHHMLENNSTSLTKKDYESLVSKLWLEAAREQYKNPLSSMF